MPGFCFARPLRPALARSLPGMAGRRRVAVRARRERYAGNRAAACHSRPELHTAPLGNRQGCFGALGIHSHATEDPPKHSRPFTLATRECTGPAE
jgi:hypothetical protein